MHDPACNQLLSCSWHVAYSLEDNHVFQVIRPSSDKVLPERIKALSTHDKLPKLVAQPILVVIRAVLGIVQGTVMFACSVDAAGSTRTH